MTTETGSGKDEPDDAALEVIRKAIEDELIKRRDARISVLRANGLCVHEADGRESSLIRMGHEEAFLIGLGAWRSMAPRPMDSPKPAPPQEQG